MKNVFITILICLTGLLSMAQEEQKVPVNPILSINYLTGNVKQTSVLESKNSHYVQLSTTFETGLHETSLYNYYKKPEVGFSLMYGYMGDKDIYGHMFSVFPTWQYNFINKEKYGLNIKLGTGIAYFNKPFDKITNPNNLRIGSPITNITEMSTNLWFVLAPNWKMQAGISYLHFSNSHVRIPNLAINDFAFRLGCIYKPGTLQGLQFPKHKPFVQDSVWRKNLSLSYGYHELAFSLSPVDGPLYNVYKVSGYISKKFSKIHEFQFGLGITYYDSYYSYMKLHNLYKYSKFIRATQTTVRFGHEFLMNRFGFVTDIGIKITDPFYRIHVLENKEVWDNWKESYFNNRIGFKYYPINDAFAGKKLSLGLFINTHFGIADFLEYNLTFTF